MKTHGVGVALRKDECKELGPVSGRGNSFPTYDAESKLYTRKATCVQKNCLESGQLLQCSWKATCAQKNCLESGHLLQSIWKRHVPIRIVQNLGTYYRAVGSDMYPEEWCGIWAPTAEQLESDMCPEEWRRLWAATAEQLESDMCPEKGPVGKRLAPIRMAQNSGNLVPTSWKRYVARRMARNRGTYYRASGKRHVSRRIA